MCRVSRGWSPVTRTVAGDGQVQDNASVWGTMRQIDFSKSVLKCDCKDLSAVRFISGIVTIRAATHDLALSERHSMEKVRQPQMFMVVFNSTPSHLCLVIPYVLCKM